MNNTIKHLPNGDFEVLCDAAEIHSDKGYEESTLEKQAEFDKNRNYHYTNNPTEWDNWKSIK